MGRVRVRSGPEAGGGEPGVDCADGGQDKGEAERAVGGNEGLIIVGW